MAVEFKIEPIIEKKQEEMGEISQNRTLYVGQFTNKVLMPELFTEATSIQDVYNCFKPTEEAKIALETEYLTLDLFFKNAGQVDKGSLSIINVDKNDFKDSNSIYYKALTEEIDANYTNANAYSLLVIPGDIFVDKCILFLYAQLAEKYGVLLISDYPDYPDFDSMMSDIDKKGYADDYTALQNVVMCCNWLLGRKKVNEDDDLYIPPSGALAGLLYNNKDITISQSRAGQMYGTIYESKDCRLHLLMAEVNILNDKLVIPMIYSKDRVMAFGDSTLYNGYNKMMQYYPTVRVLDWIKKTFINILNKDTFINWNKYESPKILKKYISDFLNKYKLFIDFRWLEAPYKDPITEEIRLKIEIEPNFSAEKFSIELISYNV